MFDMEMPWWEFVARGAAVYLFLLVMMRLRLLWWKLSFHRLIELCGCEQLQVGVLLRSHEHAVEHAQRSEQQ